MNKIFNEYKRFFDSCNINYSYDEIEVIGMTVCSFYINSAEKLKEIEFQAFQWGCEYREIVTLGNRMYVHYKIELNHETFIQISIEIPTH